MDGWMDRWLFGWVEREVSGWMDDQQGHCLGTLGGSETLIMSSVGYFATLSSPGALCMSVTCCAGREARGSCPGASWRPRPMRGGGGEARARVERRCSRGRACGLLQKPLGAPGDSRRPRGPSGWHSWGKFPCPVGREERRDDRCEGVAREIWQRREGPRSAGALGAARRPVVAP